jgi:hypothetical protein
MGTRGMKRVVSTLCLLVWSILLYIFVDFTQDTGNARLVFDPANTTPTTDPADPTDAANADLLEELSNIPRATNLEQEQDHHNEAQSPVPLQPIETQLPPAQLMPPAQPDADVSNPPPLVIDRFPRGTAGAQVPGMPQSSSVYDSSQEALGASCWAPFHSQCNWEIAYWAKMCGPSSSAMEELLAIPEVHVGSERRS